MSNLFMGILLFSPSFSLGNWGSCCMVFGVKIELVVLTTSLSSIADMAEEDVEAGLQLASFTGGSLTPVLKEEILAAILLLPPGRLAGVCRLEFIDDWF